MDDLNQKTAEEELKKGYKDAEELLNNQDKMEEFLQKLEKKLQLLPVAGDILSMVPTMISLIKSYFKKEYKDIPVGTIIAVISALTYWLTPIDVIPDVVPGWGMVDDTLVIGACLKLVGDDLKDYKKWREENNKLID